jgi:leucyl-tRNA synthetase
MVCKETLTCPEHGFLFPQEARSDGGKFFCTKCGKEVTVGRVEKMSKSKKNVIDPNTLLQEYGADTVRLFCLFAAPPERDLEWSEQGVDGGFRFLNRIWRLANDWMPLIQNATPYAGPVGALEGNFRDLFHKTHVAIQKVSGDIEDRFHFNTAISAVMELVNRMYAINVGAANHDGAGVMRTAIESVILLMSPIVPHFAEELWAALGHTPGSLATTPWPEYREDALSTDSILVVVQVNGKLRGKFQTAADTDDAAIKEMAMSDENVVRSIGGQKVKKIIVVKKKLVNIVL